MVFTRFFEFTRRFRVDQSGAALVEFAVVLPMLLLIMLGTFIWGYTISLNDSMFDAARQAAREMAVGVSNEAQAAASAANLLSAWPTTFTITAEDIDTTGTQDVRVVITTDNVFANFVPFVPTLDEMRAEVVMREE